jgi:ligand-binding sensor domain-containing protein
VQYTVKDGLPQMQCMTLLQDSKGFIWIGTKGGVSRFNGIHFKNFTIADGLPQNRIYKILEDSKANIWVLTENGLSVLKNNKFVFFSTSQKMLFATEEVIIDKNDNFWLIEGKQQTRIVKFNKNNYQEIYQFNNKDDQKLINLNYDKQNDIIYFSIRNKQNYKQYSIQNEKIELLRTSNVATQTIYKERLKINTVYNQKSTPLYQLFNLNQQKEKPILNFNEPINLPIRLNDSTMVFTTTRFVAHMPLHYMVNGQVQKNVKHFDYINDILQDTEKNIWLATEKGLYKITPFNNFTSKDNLPDYVWSIVEDNAGKLWFSSYGNRYLYYMQNHKIHRYPKQFNSPAFFFGASKISNGNLLFPTEHGVYVYDGKQFVFDNLSINSSVLSIYEDRIKSKIYFGSFEGLIIKDNEGNITVNKRFVKGKDNLVMAMTQNKKNELWYVTRNAFGVLNRKDTLVMHNDTLKGATCIYCDYKNNLWIGTEQGLFFYDYKSITRISHPELQTMIGSIVQTDSTHFVYGGLRGIGILDLKKFYNEAKFKQKLPEIYADNLVDYYNQSHGFFGEEVGQVGIYKDSKGQIWVPTNTNVVMFDPKKLVKNSKSPYTYIESMKISDDNINWHEINDTIREFKHQYKNIRFDFFGISHTAPDMVKYKYRLVGFNEKWSNPTKEPYAIYTNLPHGNYTFELLSANNNNIWNAHIISKNFTITPAWWQSFWVQLLALLAMLSFVIILIVLLYRQKIKKANQNARLNDLQLQAVQSQLYPHLLFNAVSATGSVIYKEDKNTAYDFVVKLSQFMRKALVDAKKQYKSLQEEMDFVKSYLQLQKIRFSERFDYEIVIEDKVDLQTKVPQMTIQTYVENAVKHGLEPLKNGGVLKINILSTDRGIKIIIEDNGVGIQASQTMSGKNTGIGLQVMNDIFEIHNQQNNCKIAYELIDLYKINQVGTQSIISIKCR